MTFISGLMSRADPAANWITWKTLSPVSRDPGTAIPGSRLTGLTRFSKAPEKFWARKATFSSSVSENGEVYRPEISFVKRTSVYVNNTWIKQLYNHKL